ncbi:uncharacterized protein KY384_008726 [Bacidia gigantensis]|uniref:uncharacterized protein n=1 Tax=Bacidia gigantensis TaxID=2732470 RepID=UPI001D059679|nr:uncharacterized protein KY384_008726 [Bacidia gigantensis]KAG8526526.1 hypothetical protein KY384_008726 [Bacidia gigantensis]
MPYYPPYFKVPGGECLTNLLGFRELNRRVNAQEDFEKLTGVPLIMPGRDISIHKGPYRDWSAVSMDHYGRDRCNHGYSGIPNNQYDRGVRDALHRPYGSNRYCEEELEAYKEGLRHAKEAIRTLQQELDATRAKVRKRENTIDNMRSQRQRNHINNPGYDDDDESVGRSSNFTYDMNGHRIPKRRNNRQYEHANYGDDNYP